MAELFARLYDTDVGQVLVKLDEGDGGPEVRYFFRPPGLGVCSLAIEFSDDDAGWNKAEAWFESVDQPGATSVAVRAINELST